MTLSEYLRGLTPYPVPEEAIRSLLAARGLEDSDFKQGAAASLITADFFAWLSHAPNVSQGGQSYTFTAEDRKSFLRLARLFYRRGGEPREDLDEDPMPVFGFKGTRL